MARWMRISTRVVETSYGWVPQALFQHDESHWAGISIDLVLYREKTKQLKHCSHISKGIAERTALMFEALQDDLEVLD